MKNKIVTLLKTDYSLVNDELKYHIQNHLCILISSYLEIELQNILDNYKTTRHCNDHPCKKDIVSMRKIQNAKWCSIRPMLTNIDNIIIKKLSRVRNFNPEIIFSIDNIVKTRHKIAHGEDVGTLTLEILANDFRNIEKFLKQLKKIFLTF